MLSIIAEKIDNLLLTEEDITSFIFYKKNKVNLHNNNKGFYPIF
ncbi:hypothetical protein THIOSC15_3090001 [uncultured Thiomicrorhabdus sp.]